MAHQAEEDTPLGCNLSQERTPHSVGEESCWWMDSSSPEGKLVPEPVELPVEEGCWVNTAVERDRRRYRHVPVRLLDL